MACECNYYTCRECSQRIEKWQRERDALVLRRISGVEQLSFELYVSEQLSEWGKVHMASCSLGEATSESVPFAFAVSRHPKRAIAHALRDLADILERESREG